MVGGNPHPGDLGERVRIASGSRRTSLGKRPNALTCTNAPPTRACTWDDQRISPSVTAQRSRFPRRSLGVPAAMSDLSGSLVFDKGSLWKTKPSATAEVFRNGPRRALHRVTTTGDVPGNKKGRGQRQPRPSPLLHRERGREHGLLPTSGHFGNCVVLSGNVMLAGIPAGIYRKGKGREYLPTPDLWWATDSGRKRDTGIWVFLGFQRQRHASGICRERARVTTSAALRTDRERAKVR